MLMGFSPAHVFVLMAIVGLLVVAVTFALRDAKLRGKSPLGVFLLVMSFFPLGLAIWLVFRPEPIGSDTALTNMKRGPLAESPIRHDNPGWNTYRACSSQGSRHGARARLLLWRPRL